MRRGRRRRGSLLPATSQDGLISPPRSFPPAENNKPPRLITPETAIQLMTLRDHLWSYAIRSLCEGKSGQVTSDDAKPPSIRLTRPASISRGTGG